MTLAEGAIGWGRDPESRGAACERLYDLCLALGCRPIAATRTTTAFVGIVRRLACETPRVGVVVEVGDDGILCLSLAVCAEHARVDELDPAGFFHAVEPARAGGEARHRLVVRCGTCLPGDGNAVAAAVSDVLSRRSRSELVAELRSRNRELEEVARLRSEFLANVSHELRTPMNAILGFTRRIVKKAGPLLPARQLENLKAVERNGLRLLDMINSLLDFSKIDAGRMEVHPEPFSLEELAQEVVELLAPLAEDKGLELRCASSGPRLELVTDRSMVRQILVNLVGNAIKFTAVGGVYLDLQHAGDEATIEVRDTGVGIPPEARTTVFEAFRQADGSHTRRAGGTGLGLAITRELAGLLGGVVELDSQVGVGSTFRVHLPRIAPADATLPPPKEVSDAKRPS